MFFILVGFIAAVAFHYFVGAYLRWPFPYNTFLFLPQAAFKDFYDPHYMCRGWNPYFEPYSFPFNYFPLAGVLFGIAGRLPRDFAYGVAVAAFLTPLILMASRQLRGRNAYESATNALVVTLLTYPVLFTLDRGNCEGLLFVCLCGSVLMSDRRPILKSLLLAIPIGMKVYPAVFLVLLLSERKYKQIALTIAWVVGFSAASLLCFKSGYAASLAHIYGGFDFYKTWPLFGWNHAVFNHTGLFMPLKVLLVTLDDHVCRITFWEEFKMGYRWASLVLFGLLTLYIVFIEQERWKKVALLVFAMLLLPEMAAAYKLIHILLPLFLFVNAARPGKRDFFYVCMFSLLLVPKHYYCFTGPFTTDTGYQDLSISAFIDPLLMIVMGTTMVIDGWKARINNRCAAASSPAGGGVLAHGTMP